MTTFTKLVAVGVALFLASLGARLVYTRIMLDAATEALESVNAQAQQVTARQQARAQAQRAESRRGQDLRRRCEEFRQAYAANGGTYALEQTELACTRYERYVVTGRSTQ